MRLLNVAKEAIMKKLSIFAVFLLVFSPVLAVGGSIFPPGPVFRSFSTESVRERALNPKKLNRDRRRLREERQRRERRSRREYKKPSTGGYKTSADSYKWNVHTRQFELVK